MNKGKLLVLLMCILVMLFVASASASDLNETNVMENDGSLDESVISVEDVEDNQEDFSLDDEKLRVNEYSGVLSTNFTPESFSDIQNVINNASNGDTIILDGSYVANPSDSVVIVNKSVNFIGINGATIDGISKIKLFYVSESGVSFKNIIFKNGNSTDNGGAISGWGWNTILVENCSFINNTAQECGGALYYVDAMDCTFINNSARDGGAVLRGRIENCTFINNSATGYGSAFYGEITVMKSTFINNIAKTSVGGAVYGCNYASVVNCTFINNYGRAVNSVVTAVNCSFVNNSGGAMIGGSAVNCSFVNNFNGASSCMAVNCSFVNNSGYNGGALAGSAVNCSFVNNSGYYGGAMYGSSAVNCSFVNNYGSFGGAMYRCDVLNCTFINNSAKYGGGALYDSNAKDSIFVNNYAVEGGAISAIKTYHSYDPYDLLKNITISNCTFINNSASSMGGAIEAYHVLRNFYITDCVFISNVVREGNGGAIIVLRATFDVNNCSFNNNRASGKGGAIYAETEGNIIYSYFNDSSSNQGTTIWTESNLKISFCNYTNCTSSDDGNYLGSSNLSLYNVSDCIFDVAPKGISYHYTTSLTVNDLCIAKGQKGILYANLSNILGSLVNKKVNFMFNGRKFYSVTNSEGIAEFNVNNYLTNLGETFIDLSFSGDEINDPSATNTTVYINKYFGNLTVVLDGHFYNDTFLKFRLVNSITNVPISDAPIQMNFSNGDIVNLTTDFEGNAVYLIPFIPDTYSVSAYVNEDFVNVNNVSVENIVIKKLIGDIEVIPLNDNHTLMIRLFDPDDSSAVYRNVKINLDVGPKPIIKEELFTNENGYLVYDLLNFTKGTYSISVTVKGDYKDFYDYFLADYVISNLLNSKLNFSNNITFEFGEFGSCNFTVEGGIVEYNNIRVLNNTDALIDLSANTISVSQLSVGDYVLQVETTPDEYHNPINKTVNIVVTNAKSKVTFSAGIVFEYGSSSSIHVVVEGGKVERKNIQIVGHPEAGIEFSGNVIIVSGLAVGTYDLQVISTPDSDHLASTGTVKVTVKKATAVIKASKITVAYKKGGEWTIKFIDSKSGKAIKNMKVTLKVYTGKKFKTVNLKTDSKGEATYQTKKLSKGNHKVKVSATDSRYNFNSYSSSIKVVKQTALKFKVKTKSGTDGASLSITVMNKKTKKRLNGVKIKLKIYNGKKLFKTVVLKSMKKGKYKGVCGYGTNKLSVGKHKVEIVPYNIKYGGSKTVTMKITKKHKKAPAWETKDTAK